MLLRFTLPVAELCARMGSGGAGRLQKLRGWFVLQNNRLVVAGKHRCAAGELLVLLPHCLQQTGCGRRLTHKLDNCQRCGGCVVGDLLHMGDLLGVGVAVAVGGTIARRMVRDARPHVVIAVACERDLVSGIQDCAPLPVYGVVNSRPCGDCINTTVNVADVTAAVRLFVAGK